MAAELVLLLALISFSVGKADKRLVDLECKPADGIVGQTTNISCSFIASSAGQHITVIAASVIKSGQEDPLFTFYNNVGSGDARFKLPSVNDSSLELTDTAVTDEGEYEYEVVTNCGIIKDKAFRISVTAKYNEPTTNSWPEKIEDGGHVDLYCNASGGYPVGVIHWFDRMNTDWTKNATLETKEVEDKLLHMSSKLSITSIDPSWAPFRCVVLNSKNDKEGESTFQLKMTGDGPGSPVTVTVGVVVAGFIVIVALIVLLFHRKRIQQVRRPSAQPILRNSHEHNTDNEAEDEDEAEAEAEDEDEDEDDDAEEQNATEQLLAFRHPEELKEK